MEAKNTKAQELPLFRDPDQPLEARIEDLLSRLTLEEKVSQMIYNSLSTLFSGNSRVQLVERMSPRRWAGGSGHSFPSVHRDGGYL